MRVAATTHVFETTRGFRQIYHAEVCIWGSLSVQSEHRLRAFNGGDNCDDAK